MVNEFQKFGRLLFDSDLISSHGGNISVREKEKIFITRRNAMLSNLEQRDIVEVPLKESENEILNTGKASRELPVHRAIYEKAACEAVLHAHPVNTIALSFIVDSIQPFDEEGQYTLKEIPILKISKSIGSQEVAAKIPSLLKEHPVVVLRGHGIFAVGGTLEEAYKRTSTLECSSKIILLAKNAGFQGGE